MQQTLRSGFTLVELSIVLIIVGLIAGGVLVGQNLINAASIRATISQIEKYNTAANAFRLKYQYLPGDLPNNLASSYGFFAETTLGGTFGHQDGNGLIQGGFAGFVQIGETIGFWRHLTDAQMVDGSFGIANPLDPATGKMTTTTTAVTTHQLVPRSKLGRGNYVMAFSYDEGINYFQLEGVTSIDTLGAISGGMQITPIEAQEIDTKRDDGLPNTGKVHARVFNMLTFPAGFCVTAAPVVYDIGSANGNTPEMRTYVRI